MNGFPSTSHNLFGIGGVSSFPATVLSPFVDAPISSWEKKTNVPPFHPSVPKPMPNLRVTCAKSAGNPEPCLLLQHTAYNTTCLYLICATYGFLNLWSIMMCILYNTVDGRNPANLLIWRIYHYVQGFIHVRWLAGFLPSTVSSQQMCKNIHRSSNRPSCFYMKLMTL